ncbi:hypothetical protein ACFX15_012689 [Malus domestica]
MASMATLSVNTPYPSHSFPKSSSAHFAPVLKLSTHIGLIEPNDGNLVQLFVEESKKGETKKEAAAL